jgi:putative N6-adenine-specific DNA methylase
MRLSCSVVCAPGLEAIVADEMRGLGVKPGSGRRGGVAFTATTRQLYLANRFLRTATRVLVRVGRFRASTWDQLVAGANDVPWDELLAPTRPVHLRVSSSGARLYHTGAIAERVAPLLDRPLAADASDDAQLVVVRVAHDEVSISLDSSGEALHRRPWRLAGAKAPLRPTIAAALLLAVGWDGSTPLVDPFCGSGTIAIEAALLARGLPPGGDRDFAFRHWPGFEPGTWASVLATGSPEDAKQPILAADRDAGAVAATKENAERAGVLDALEVEEQPLSALALPPTGGWLVTNPPYGRRVAGGGDLRNLYARLGDIVRAGSGWRIGLLAADERLARHSGLPLAERFQTTNGGLPVRFLTT